MTTKPNKKQQNPLLEAFEWLMGSSVSMPRALGLRFDVTDNNLIIKRIDGGRSVGETVVHGSRVVRRLMGAVVEAAVVTGE